MYIGLGQAWPTMRERRARVIAAVSPRLGTSTGDYGRDTSCHSASAIVTRSLRKRRLLYMAGRGHGRRTLGSDPSAYGPHTMIYTRYNRWSQRGVWQRLFAKIATAGPVPDEVKLDASHVKAHRSAAGGTGGPGARRSAARAACSRAKSIAWPMVVADRLRSPSGPATWPTSPCRCLSCGPWCRPSA